MHVRVHSLQATWQDSHLVPRLWAVQHRTVGASVHPSGQTADHQPSRLRPFQGHATGALRRQCSALPRAHHRQTLWPLSGVGPPSPAKQHRRRVGDVPQQGGVPHIVPAHGVHAMVVGVVHPTSCHFPSLGAGRWILMATSCPGLFHPASLLCSHQSTTRSPTGQRQHRQPLLCLFRHVARQEVKHPRPCGPRIHPRGCIFCTRRTESRVCVVICLHAILLFRSIVLFLVVLFCVH